MSESLGSHLNSINSRIASLGEHAVFANLVERYYINEPTTYAEDMEAFIFRLASEQVDMVAEIDEALLAAQRQERRYHSKSNGCLLAKAYLDLLSADLNEPDDTTFAELKAKVTSLYPGVPVVLNADHDPLVSHTMPIGAVVHRYPQFKLIKKDPPFEESNSRLSLKTTASFIGANGTPIHADLDINSLCATVVGSAKINEYIDTMHDTFGSRAKQVLSQVMPLQETYIPGPNPSDELQGILDLSTY